MVVALEDYLAVTGVRSSRLTGDSNMPPSLLEQDSSTDRGSEETPSLVVAVLADDVQEVRRVLEAQPDTASSLHSQARMALHLAMTGKRKAGVEVVRALLGAHVGAAKHKDRCGAMPLHKAVQGKRAGAAVVTTLLTAYPAAARRSAQWPPAPSFGSQGEACAAGGRGCAAAGIPRRSRHARQRGQDTAARGA